MRQTVDQENRLGWFHRFVRDTRSLKPPKAVLDLTVRRVCEVLNVDTSYIKVARPSEGIFRIEAQEGLTTDRFNDHQMLLCDGLGGFVWKSQHTIYVRDYYHENRFTPFKDTMEITRQEGITSFLATPVLRNAECVGILYAASRRIAAFHYDDVVLLELVAQQVGNALVASEANEGQTQDWHNCESWWTTTTDGDGDHGFSGPATHPKLAVELSPREIQVLLMLARGARYHEIGQSLFISDNTVRFHVNNMRHRFGCRTVAELIALVRPLGP